jgi:predicted nucleic acid-binding Zn ribbon protein
MSKQNKSNGKPGKSSDQRRMRTNQIIMAVIGIIIVLSMVIAAVANY